jgi:hypothetical protein
VIEDPSGFRDVHGRLLFLKINEYHLTIPPEGGTTNLDALKLIEPHKYRLRDHAAQILAWNGRRLIPLYHRSPQVIITVRPLAQQIEDFKTLAEAIG